MKKAANALLLVAIGALTWATIPYWLPTSIALGPCGKDWTSPTSYQPRASPMRSVEFRIGEVNGKVCYGSPSARGREVFGGLVPWNELWRTGANEPTRLFVDGEVEVAGIVLPAGRYSLYTIPGPESWQLFVSTSTFHWGNEINSSVRADEMGSARLEPSTTAEHVEQMTMSWEPAGDASGRLTLEWERTRIEIPLSNASG